MLLQSSFTCLMGNHLIQRKLAYLIVTRSLELSEQNFTLSFFLEFYPWNEESILIRSFRVRKRSGK